MRKIVAIGGGSMSNGETLSIDQAIIQLTDKKQPTALFIPTASNDDDEYCQTFNTTYGDQLGCKVDVLKVLDNNLTEHEIATKILNADLIYAGRGNALKMMRKWRFTGVSKLLRKAMAQGTVLAGISAGAMCWFAHGHSNSQEFYKGGQVGKDWNYTRVKCLGFIDRLIFCPHYHTENRERSFHQMIDKTGGIGIALEDGCAIQIVDKQFKLLAASPQARAYKLYKLRAKVVEAAIPVSDDWRSISELLSRPKV